MALDRRGQRFDLKRHSLGSLEPGRVVEDQRLPAGLAAPARLAGRLPTGTKGRRHPKICRSGKNWTANQLGHVSGSAQIYRLRVGPHKTL